MVLGFNHNVRYRGELFHVQTEDSGVTSPNITTLLYRGGTIIASRRTSYADIIRFEGLERLVEELMKDQHKEMLRRLKNGEFDDRAFPGAVRDPVAADPRETAEDLSLRQVPDPQPAATRSMDDILLDYLATEGPK